MGSQVAVTGVTGRCEQDHTGLVRLHDQHGTVGAGFGRVPICFRLRGGRSRIDTKEPEMELLIMNDRCNYLDWLYRFLLRRKTTLGRQSVIDEIKRHFREGHDGKPCPDAESRYH